MKSRDWLAGHDDQLPQRIVPYALPTPYALAKLTLRAERHHEEKDFAWRTPKLRKSRAMGGIRFGGCDWRSNSNREL